MENTGPNELPHINAHPENMGPNMMPNINPMAHKKLMFDLCKQHIGHTVNIQTIFGHEFPAHLNNVDSENVYYIPANTNRNDDDRGWGFGGMWPLLWMGGLRRFGWW